MMNEKPEVVATLEPFTYDDPEGACYVELRKNLTNKDAIEGDDRLMLVSQHERIVKALMEERDAALARVAELEAAISSALSQHGVKFMDPPDGGDTPLVEQVCRMSQAVLELEKPDPDYTQHPQIVGYARKKELEPLLDPCMPDGGYIYIGLDHPSLWAEEPPYEFLTPLYTSPPAQVQHSVPEGWKLVPIEPTPDMEQAAERYWSERKFKAFTDDPRTWAGVYKTMLDAAPSKEGEQQ